ncbi:MAG TPA: type 4a pilus biogenesis protein PilO [Desulfobacteraceae bacterium]|nr:type 4a pilus biogenesis protein PilO [Desulfobacteraceae bacterium]HPJ67431.1 type 4a pilus biogenesis protein PilO [Desulfobacteraceae bacterium]HPQ29195.1 type 4a pilus biogenesis protein PilO [Desulfobacteraceae bacterium]
MAQISFFEKVEKIKMVNRVIILVGTLALFVGLFAVLFYFPKAEQIEYLEREIASLDQKISKAKQTVKTLAKFEADYAKIEAEFQAALMLLPNEREIPSLLRNITDLGAESNLEFVLFSPAKEVTRDFYIEIPVSIQVTGNYHDVAVFFDKVGRMKRIVNIINVSMQPEKSLSTMLNTKCTAITYRFKG